MSKITLGLLQHACVPDQAANREKTLALVERAAKRGAKIICTQELAASEYFCQSEDYKNFALAETIPGPSTRAFQKLAKRYKVVIVASLFERRAHGLYHNTAVIIDADGELIGIYRKAHIPDDPLFYEKFYFTPGDTGFRAWDTRFGKIGVLICWDQWYPEAARLMALAGAQVLIYPTAIGWLPSEKKELGAAQHCAWETVQRGHAVANGCFVAAVNRSGSHGGTEFWGQSFVANPYGEIVAKASIEHEETLVYDLDFSAVENFRRIWPFFRDRRIDTYQDITQRWRH